MRAYKPQTFSPRRLHLLDDLCWAVVGDADGAILVVNGKLLMRLTYDEARAAADLASTSEFPHPSTHAPTLRRSRPPGAPRAA